MDQNLWGFPKDPLDLNRVKEGLMQHVPPSLTTKVNAFVYNSAWFGSCGDL